MDQYRPDNGSLISAEPRPNPEEPLKECDRTEAEKTPLGLTIIGIEWNAEDSLAIKLSDGSCLRVESVGSWGEESWLKLDHVDQRKPQPEDLKWEPMPEIDELTETLKNALITAHWCGHDLGQGTGYPQPDCLVCKNGWER